MATPDSPEAAPTATHAQLLVALSQLDPLAQETMIAKRLATLPSQKDGSGPVNLPRMIRGPWAHHLRKLGIFCIPELATHELVDPDPATMVGPLANFTPSDMQPVTIETLWERVKVMNPALVEEVEAARSAEDPGARKALMTKLFNRMPQEHRIIAQRLLSTDPETLTPR